MQTRAYCGTLHAVTCPCCLSMNSLARMLTVLELYKPGTPIVDIAAICNHFGYAPASAYRYVRELCAVGLLVRLPGGYGLGPRIIELDLLMREYDPLVGGNRDLIEMLARETGLNVLLSEWYRNTVINVHQEMAGESAPLNYGRGRPMALFRSATARVILAHLPPRNLRRLYDENLEQPDLLRLGATWKIFSKEMLDIRKRGYCITEGDLDPGKAGIAAPIFFEKRVIGSITAVGASKLLRGFDEEALAEKVFGVAREITRRIGAST